MCFCGKKQKFLNVGKIRNYDEERIFLSRKESSHLLKMYLQQIGKAQNMPVVAGHLVENHNPNEVNFALADKRSQVKCSNEDFQKHFPHIYLSFLKLRSRIDPLN